MAAGRVLIEGVDITSTPRELLDRGTEQLTELTAAMQGWADSARPRIEVEIEADLTEVRDVIRMDGDPPTRRWSMLLGEAIHTYREALDGLAWDLTHVDGAEHDERVYFPIVDNGKDWRSRKRALMTMPPDALQRIRDIQPIALGAQTFSNDLWSINRFDVNKKHRAELIDGRIDWAPTERSGTWAVVTPESIHPELSEDLQLKDGAVLMRVRFDPPALEIPAPDPTALPLTFVVVEGKRSLDLGVLIAGLPGAMNDYFEYILTGESSVR